MSSMYVFAPAGPHELQSTLLKTGIEYIGMKESGCGSAWAKGRRYIKGKLFCTGTAIKRACAVKVKIINHDYIEFGLDVYYFHKEMVAPIVDLVIQYLCDHINDDSLPQVFCEKDYNTLLKLVYSHRLSQLEWVCNENYKNQHDDAERVYNDLLNLRK